MKLQITTVKATLSSQTSGRTSGCTKSHLQRPGRISCRSVGSDTRELPRNFRSLRYGLRHDSAADLAALSLQSSLGRAGAMVRIAAEPG